MLAGDVSVSVTSDNLLIFGDSQANQIRIEQEGNQTFVTGLDGTTINDSTAVFSFDSQIRDARIRLGEGDDSVLIENLSLEKNFKYFGGRGNDRLTLNSDSAKLIHAEGDQGDDVFDFGDSSSCSSS